jgi:pimeloyl-ACP methyl ester carboxylesterase
MTPPETAAEAAFYQTEAQVFARYQLRVRARRLRLREPAVSLRAVETGWEGELTRIRRPVLVIWGTQDGRYQPYVALARNSANATVSK